MSYVTDHNSTRDQDFKLYDRKFKIYDSLSWIPYIKGVCHHLSVCKVSLTPSALTWSSQCAQALGLQSEIQPLGRGVCLGIFADHCLRNSTCPDSTKLSLAGVGRSCPHYECQGGHSCDEQTSCTALRLPWDFPVSFYNFFLRVSLYQQRLFSYCEMHVLMQIP